MITKWSDQEKSGKDEASALLFFFKRRWPQTEKKNVRIGFLEKKVNYCCPKCGYLLQFTKKKHKMNCFRCGQSLDWSKIENMQAVWIEAQDAEEAGYWAAQYELLSGTAYGTDTDKWRLIRKDYPLLLYFLFPEGKGYGRFMRLAAKDAKVVKEFEQHE